mmetsp:Transcript_19642/g.34790  ORF Transcript_19642/g.34790 Transcript_19642/m.34790 type:complete len:1007 (-) Transcript_19642:69-3089(-)
MAPMEEAALVPVKPKMPHSSIEARLCAVEANPAPWPYSRVVNNKELGLEAASQVVQRTVTPEAHVYFRRIVEVAQSELEKLLINKVQHIFDPVRADSLKKTPLQDVPNSIAGVKRDLLDKGFVDPQKCKVKSAVEGQQLTAYVVSVLSRIMVDFSRFADTVLRWQRDTSGALQPHGDRGQTPSEMFQGIYGDLVERLERQDKLNTELENKYSNILAELRERKRQFLRERAVFKDRMRLVQAHARACDDKNLMQLCVHDVQFYDEGGISIEDLKDEYERKLMQQEIAFQAKLKEKESEVLEQKKEVERLQELVDELKNRKLNDNSAGWEKKLERAEQYLQEAEEALARAHEENETLKAANDGLMMQVEGLKAHVEAKDGKIQEQAVALAMAETKMTELRTEISDLRAQLAAAEAAAQKKAPQESPKKKPMLMPQYLRNLGKGLESDDRLEKAQAALLAAQEEVKALRRDSDAEIERLQRALSSAASEIAPSEKPPCAFGQTQTDPYEPNKSELAESRRREADLQDQLSMLQREIEDLKAALEAKRPEIPVEAAPKKKAPTRDFGIGDGLAIVKEEVKEPVIHRQLIPDDTVSDVSTLPPPRGPSGPPMPGAGMSEEELRAMFEYPRVRALGGGWLQALDKGHKSQRPGQSFTTAETDRSPYSTGMPQAVEPRSSSPPEFTWPKQSMPPELMSQALRRGRSPSPLENVNREPSLLPITEKAKRSTVCSSPPPHWPAPERSKSPEQRLRERSPTLLQDVMEEASDWQGTPPEMTMELEPMSSGEAWRRSTNSSGHPLAHAGGIGMSGRPASPEFDFVLEGERPPSAVAGFGRTHNSQASDASTLLRTSPPPAYANESPQAPSEKPAVATVDMLSFAIDLPSSGGGGGSFGSSGFRGALGDQVRSSYGGGFVMASLAKQADARSMDPSRGRDATMRRSASGPDATGERPGNAAQMSRPGTATRQGARLQKGSTRPGSAAKLPEVPGKARPAGALRPAAARQLSQQQLETT